MNESVENIIQNLHRLIDSKIILFQNILITTVKQKEDIDQNEGDNIEPLVAEKQQLITRIDQIDKAFSIQFGLLKKSLNVEKLEDVDGTKYPQLGDLKKKVQKIFTIIEEIMTLEKENTEKLNVIFSNLKTELKRINVGRKSLRAYEPQPINKDGIFIDKKE